MSFETAAVVLCGGLSSRMGRAKAFLPWHGQPMLLHVISVLRAEVDELIVVTSQELDVAWLDLESQNVRLVIDRVPKLGPLAGIREGLAAMRADRAFVTSTDAPFLSRRFVRSLLDRGGSCAPVDNGFVQSLHAVYSKEGAEIAERLIAEERLRPLYLLQALGFAEIPAAELPDRESLINFNRPQEYLDAIPEVELDAHVTVEFLGTARKLAGREELQVPFGLLGDVARAVAEQIPALCLVQDGKMAGNYLFSLSGRQFVRTLDVPIGPHETLVVIDASVGG